MAVSWSIHSVLLLVIVAVVLRAGCAEITRLNGHTFRSTIAHHNVLALFLTPWCTSCKPLEEALHGVRGDDLKIATLDAEQFKSLAAAEGVKSYPTVKLYTKKRVFTFSGKRTTEALQRFVDEHVSSR